MLLLLAATLASQLAVAQNRAKNKNKTIVDTPVYKQASRPIEERVADLLSRMTIEEKIAQLRCPLGLEMYTKTSDKSVEVSQKFKDIMSKAPIGSFWAVLRADLSEVLIRAIPKGLKVNFILSASICRMATAFFFFLGSPY